MGALERRFRVSLRLGLACRMLIYLERRKGVGVEKGMETTGVGREEGGLIWAQNESRANRRSGLARRARRDDASDARWTDSSARCALVRMRRRGVRHRMSGEGRLARLGVRLPVQRRRRARRFGATAVRRLEAVLGRPRGGAARPRLRGADRVWRGAARRLIGVRRWPLR